MDVASRSIDSGAVGAAVSVRRQGDLEPPLGRPQHALGHEGNAGEEGQAAQHPTVPSA